MNHDLTTPEGLAAYMKESTSAEDFNSRIDVVKRANGGDYPSFWYRTIVASALGAEIATKWGGEYGMRIVKF